MLESVFDTIYKKHKKEIPVTSKSDTSDLESFLESIVPDFDTERVYLSDIKKLVSWYSILIQYAPELFLEKKESKSEKEVTKKDSDKKPAAKKVTKPKATSASKPKPTKAKTTTPTATKAKRGS